MTTSSAKGVIEVQHLTKTFGPVRAVDDLTFTVQPGRVTGFLGPNGAGKTTTLRLLLGLAHPTAGTTTISGVPYPALPDPARTVGAALEAASFHPGRSALDHLRMYAPVVGVPDSRCTEVLELVGLSEAAKRRVGGFSLGMRQRLALATTLLGDPQVLLLDEPANGLDPEGIAWLRQFLRYLAGEGRTVLVSSHILAEVEQTVDDVIIIARGQLVHASPIADLVALAVRTVQVTAPDGAALNRLISERGWHRTTPIPGMAPAADWADATGSADTGGTTTVRLRDVTAAEVGACAFAAGIELHELATHALGLEDVFLRLVAPPPPQSPPGSPPVVVPGRPVAANAAAAGTVADQPSVTPPIPSTQTGGDR